MNRAVRVKRHGVLGTVLDLQFTVRPSVKRIQTNRVATQLTEMAYSRIDELVRVFSVFDPASELCEWRRGASIERKSVVSSELGALLERSASWQRASEGSYNPCVGLLGDRWRLAGGDGQLPSVEELASLAALISPIAYEVEGQSVAVTGSLLGVRSLSLNAFAKGHVVDQVGEAMWSTDKLERLIVNIGGDLRVWLDTASGQNNEPVRVGIEHPTRTVDNDPPIAILALTGGGLATSGSSRRGFVVDGQWFSHVIDPTTGWPITTRDAATVAASTAETADVLATVALLRGVEFAEQTVARVQGAQHSAIGVVSFDTTWKANDPFRSLIV